jgi:prephenate dehydrogenase
MRKKKIVIVGLGLMGGSVGYVLRKKFPALEVIGLARSEAKIRAAQKMKVIHWGSTNPARVLKSAKFVFICTPISRIPFWLKKSDRLARKGTIVTDVGSIKGPLVRWADRERFQKILYVGSHPMAGSHESGLRHARRDLFDKAVVLVTQSAKTNRQALRAVEAIWRKIARRVFVIGPEVHDSICARVSHLPHLIAAVGVQGLAPSWARYVGPGFLDSTRICQADPVLWLEILQANRKALSREIRAFQKRLGQVMKNLSRDRGASILSLLKTAARKRREIEKNR